MFFLKRYLSCRWVGVEAVSVSGKKDAAMLAGALAVICLGGTASADDGAVRDWSGPYGGLALGVAYSKADPDTDILDTSPAYFDSQDLSQVNPILQRSIAGTDVTGSALLGYDFQSGRMIYGAEADLTLMDFSGSEGQGRTAYDSAPTIFFTTDTTVETRFLFSLRPKLGYAAGDFLVFASAGPSVTRIKTTTRFSDTNGHDLTVTDTKTALGVSSSLGADYSMGDGWSLRGDYVFSYFPDTTDGTAEFNGDTQDDFKFDGDFQSHNVRLALIKRF